MIFIFVGDFGVIRLILVLVSSIWLHDDYCLWSLIFKRVILYSINLCTYQNNATKITEIARNDIMRVFGIRPWLASSSLSGFNINIQWPEHPMLKTSKNVSFNTWPILHSEQHQWVDEHEIKWTDQSMIIL